MGVRERERERYKEGVEERVREREREMPTGPKACRNHHFGATFPISQILSDHIY